MTLSYEVTQLLHTPRARGGIIHSSPTSRGAARPARRKLNSSMLLQAWLPHWTRRREGSGAAAGRRVRGPKPQLRWPPPLAGLEQRGVGAAVAPRRRATVVPSVGGALRGAGGPAPPVPRKTRKGPVSERPVSERLSRPVSASPRPRVLGIALFYRVEYVSISRTSPGGNLPSLEINPVLIPHRPRCASRLESVPVHKPEEANLEVASGGSTPQTHERAHTTGALFAHSPT